MTFTVRAAVATRNFDVSLAVGPGETVAIMGPNGAGKSTLLNIIAGLAHPDSGKAELDGNALFDLEDGRGHWTAPHSRGTALLAQEALLFPHLSVLENVAFGPRSAGASKRDAGRSALRWLAEGFSERSGIRVDTIVGAGVEALSQDAATALFRVAQECLANVHRHSGSSWARIAIQRIDGSVRLDVSDGGSGSQPRPAANKLTEQVPDVGVGVSGMRIRLEQLRGNLQIDSGPTGTRVTATVPLT